MAEWHPEYVNTVCYLLIGRRFRLTDAPSGSEARGWAWACFEEPYGVQAVMAGWIHPDIRYSEVIYEEGPSALP